MARGYYNVINQNLFREDKGASVMGKNLGDKISELLQEQQLTQKELAERIDITETAMSRYINGSREPKPDVIANMATALHTTADYLLGIENNYSLQRLIARNAKKMTDEEKKDLIKAILGGK